jgi:hypothetical protein
MNRIFAAFVAILWLLGAVPVSAQWAIFMASSAGSPPPSNPAGATLSNGFVGQIKPTGPIELNRKSIYAGLVNVYDRGDGIYVDATNNNPPINQVLSATYSSGAGVCSLKGAATPYGTAALWPGACITSQCAGDGCTSSDGLGYVIPAGSASAGGTNTSGLAINTASGLGALGAGAGYSVFASFIWTGVHVTNDYSWYVGRTWLSSGEGWMGSCASPSGVAAMWAFIEAFDYQQSHYGLITAAVTTGTNASPSQGCIGTFQMVAGTYYEMNIDCVNTSSGTATCEFMVNGVFQSNLTGVAIPTCTVVQSECYDMIGATWHDSDLSNHTPAAFILKHSFVPRHLTRQQRQYHWLNPWTEYQPKGSH